MTLVYILMYILDGLDGCANFNIDMTFIPGRQISIIRNDIDMTVIPGRQISVIRNDVAVVKGLAPGIGVGPAIVRPGIFGITVISKTCFWTKILWITLGALALNHARGIWELITARTMHHTLGDGGVKLGMSDRIRDLRRNHGVDMRGITDQIGRAHV